MNEPLVYVLIINWNGREHLDVCIRSLLMSTHQNAKFVLIDNASDDDSVAFVREKFGKDQRVDVLQAPQNLGWSRGNNLGLERAVADSADYVLLLNNDTWTDVKAIEEMVALAESRTNTGALAPKMVLYDTPSVLNSVGLEVSIIGAAWDRGLGRADDGSWDAIEPVAGVCGGAMFVRTSVLEKTGSLPTDFDIYLDDLDLCLRIWNAGFDVLTCPGAVIRHKFSATMGSDERARHKYFLNTRNRFRLLQRNLPLWAVAKAGLAVVKGEAKALGRAAVAGEWWKWAAHAKGWWQSLLYIPAAIRERVRRRRRGIHVCRFWSLVRDEPLFFPGVPLPKDGWYPERRDGEGVLRPMAQEARYRGADGPVRIQLAHPYAHLEPYTVEVRGNGEILATLQSDSAESVTLEVPEGDLTFAANKVFSREKTGERMDVAAWVRLESVN